MPKTIEDTMTESEANAILAARTASEEAARREALRIAEAEKVLAESQRRKAEIVEEQAALERRARRVRADGRV